MKKHLKLTLIMTAIILFVAAAVVLCVALLKSPAEEQPHTDDSKVELEFLPVDNETVYAFYDLNGDGYCDDDVKINMRDFPTSDSDIVISLDGGTVMTRIGIYYENDESESGWSMVIYNGETLYCRNSCLSTKDPAENKPYTNY